MQATSRVEAYWVLHGVPSKTTSNPGRGRGGGCGYDITCMHLMLHSTGHTLDVAAELLFGSSTRDRHAFGQSTHGDLTSAASIRVITGGCRLGLFGRLLDELVQLC